MIDFHSSVPVKNEFNNRPRTSFNENPTLLFSARPKIQELPFLNNLKVIRQLLIALKNQKLRKSLYVVTQGYQKIETQGSDIFRHQKAKLSVMDLISEQGKFQQLSNTIQSNLNRQSISPIQVNSKLEIKKQPQQFKIINDIFESQKQKTIKNIYEKPTILTRKNQLASDLNQLGHELEETYVQVQELQKIFGTLCNFYSDNRKIVDKNLKLKEQRDLIHEKIQQFQTKIANNQRDQIILKDKLQDFICWYRYNISQYVKEVIQFNKQVHTNQQNIFINKQIPRKIDLQQKQKYIQSLSEEGDQIQKKTFQINLKFKNLKTQLERIKTDKKTAAQNKNKEKKIKNQTNDSNTFSKLYVSEIYSL